MNKLIQVLLFTLTISSTFGQKQGLELIDSLKTQLTTAVDDTNKVLLLGKLSFESRHFDTESGIQYGEQSLELAEKLEWNKGIAAALNDLGTNYAIRGTYPKALDYFIKSFDKFTKIKNQAMIAALANNIGWIYMNMDNPDKAILYYKKALVINIKLHDIKGQSLNYGNLGIIRSSKTFYKEGIDYFTKALEIDTQLNDKDAIARDYINIAANKLLMNEFCESLDFGFKALAVSNKIKSTYNQANSHKMIGDCFLALCKDSIKVPTDCKYFSQNKKEILQLAKQHLLESYKLYEQINDLRSVSDASLSISKMYEKMGDSKNALEFYKNYSSNKDSVYSKDNSLKIANLEKINEVTQRDNEIKIKNIELKNKNIQLLFQLLISILILVAAALITFFFYKKQKAQKIINIELDHKNAKLAELNATKDKFFSIIAHDLRGPLSGFLKLTEVMAEGLSDMTLDEIQHIVRIMKKSATNLFSLLGNLLEWSRLQSGSTIIEPVIFNVHSKVVESITFVLDAATKKEISIHYNIPENLNAFADSNMFESIIRNIASNAVKFTPPGGKIDIMAKSVSDNFTEISISDTGIGMNKTMITNLFSLNQNTSRKGTEGESSTGLGLIICKEFIEKNGGELTVESTEGKGSTFRFTLPNNIETLTN